MQKLINHFILNLLRLFCLISFVLISIPTSFASETFSYSGRLVHTNGSPVPGRVNLTFDLAYSDQPGVILCTEDLNNVDLVNGVFHVKLGFGSCNLSNVLANISNGQTLNIRVTDRTPDPDRVYSFQSIHSVPQSIMSQMSKQLVQMDAVDGQVLTWRNGKWGAEGPTGATSGTVTQITATDGLSGGIITNTGTIGILDNGVTSSKILDDTIVDTDISSTAEIAQSKIKNLTTDLAAKESSIGTGNSTDYLDGTKAWNNFDQSVRNALLIGYTTGSATPIAATDNVMEAIGKLEGQIIANDTAFDNAGQWDKDGTLLFYNSGNVGVGTATPSDKLEVVGDVALSGKLRLKNSALSYVELKAPVGAGAITYTLPGTLGSNGQILSTDNLGNLSWLTPSTDSSQITDGSIVDADISASANIAQSKISGLATSLGNKQDVIATSDTTTYYRGDKTWQTLTTDAVPEGSKLYFTEPLVLGTDLAGFTSGPGIISASDTLLTAINKLDGNISAVSSAQANYVLKAGDTMTGPLGVVAPTADDHAANKLYVDTQTALSASKWAASGSEIFYNAGNVGIGTNDPSMPLHITSTGWGTILAQKSSNDNSGAEIHFYKSRGTPSAMLPVQANDRLMGLYGAGTYSSTQVSTNAAGIQMMAAENFTSTAQGTLIDFGTTATGTTTRLTRMTISPEGNVGIGTTNPQGRLDVKGALLLSGATSGYVGLAPAAVAGSTIYTLPSSDGSAGDLLKTNGAGVLSWQAPQSTTPTGAAGGDLSGTYPNPTITGLAATKISGGAIDNTEFNYLDGVSSNIQTQLNSKQATIAAGVNTQYWRGDKTWQDFDAAARSALLFGYGISAGTVASGDSLQTAISKVDGNIAALQANGQWNKSGSDISYSAGGVGIGTSSPSASSAFEIASTTQGFLPPRMTLTQRDAILSPAPGLLIYNTTSNSIQYYNNSEWVELNGGKVVLDTGTISGTVTLTKTLTVTQNAVVIFNSHMFGSNYPMVSLRVDGVACAHDRSFASTGNQYSSASCVKELAPGTHTIDSLYTETSGTSNMGTHSMSWVLISKSSGTSGSASSEWDLNGTDLSYLTGKVGIGTSSPQAALDVNGGIKVGTQATCDASVEGTQRYNSTLKVMEFCNGTSWNAIGATVGTPIGSIQTMMTASCPANHLTANGAAVSRTTYANLFAAIGTMYGAGDGSTTFNLPDLRGYFLRGVSTGSGSDPDAASRTNRGDGTGGDNVGSKQVDAIQQHNHYMTSEAPGTNNVVAFSDTNTDSTYASGGNVGSRGDVYIYVGDIRTGRAATETRPKNINVLYCIRY